MGLFCGKKCECKRNCKSWFAGDAALIDGCKNRCKATGGDSPTSRNDYLNQIGAGSQQAAAWQQTEQQLADEAAAQTRKWLLIIGGIVLTIIVVLVAIKLLRKFKK